MYYLNPLDTCLGNFFADMALKWVGHAYKDAQSNYENEETNVGSIGSLMVYSINHYIFYSKKILCVFYTLSTTGTLYISDILLVY